MGNYPIDTFNVTLNLGRHLGEILLIEYDIPQEYKPYYFMIWIAAYDNCFKEGLLMIIQSIHLVFVI